MNYDIIIVGAGIAGVSTAINLRKLSKDLKILVIEKNKFPRNKLCAGYLTKKSVVLLKSLGININDIDYKLVKGLSIIYKDKKRICMHNHGLYCQELVDRTILDYELFKKLKENNIDVIEKSYIKDVNEEEKNLILNGNNKYYYNNLVFADGELGYSNKYNNETKKYIALQVNFREQLTPKIDMFFGITKKGYAWCAGSGEYINIGFCDIYDKNIDYIKKINDFVNKLGYESKLNKNRVKGFFVPFGIKKNRIIKSNIFLVGDAVGVVDPLTLAGISYALMSGEYVAKSIVQDNNKIYLKFLKKLELKFTILKILFNILYNPIFLFLFIRVGGRFFGNMLSFLLDKFILNKEGSFHD
jgi:flavin-dependent dehydrogenase